MVCARSRGSAVISCTVSKGAHLWPFGLRPRFCGAAHTHSWLSRSQRAHFWPEGSCGRQRILTLLQARQAILGFASSSWWVRLGWSSELGGADSLRSREVEGTGGVRSGCMAESIGCYFCCSGGVQQIVREDCVGEGGAGRGVRADRAYEFRGGSSRPVHPLRERLELVLDLDMTLEERRRIPAEPAKLLDRACASTPTGRLSPDRPPLVGHLHAPVTDELPCTASTASSSSFASLYTVRTLPSMHCARRLSRSVPSSPRAPRLLVPASRRPWHQRPFSARHSPAFAPAKSDNKEGTIADVFSSLGGDAFVPLEQRFADLKQALWHDGLIESWRSVLSALEERTAEIVEHGNKVRWPLGTPHGVPARDQLTWKLPDGASGDPASRVQRHCQWRATKYRRGDQARRDGGCARRCSARRGRGVEARPRGVHQAQPLARKGLPR